MANIQDVRAINTPQKSYMWEVEIQGLSTGSLDAMAFYAKTISIPQTAVEQIIINHKSAKAHHVGRDSAAHTVTLTFWDDENQTLTSFFQEWMDILIHNPITGGSTSRDIYSATMLIRLKDSTDETVTGEIALGHCWPMDIAEIPLSYDSSEPVEISVTMSYDEKTVG